MQQWWTICYVHTYADYQGLASAVSTGGDLEC